MSWKQQKEEEEEEQQWEGEDVQEENWVEEQKGR